MADFKLFLPVFFLLSLSFISAFGDAGNLTVVSGKSYQINYDAKYVQILSAMPNNEDQALIISIQATNPIATLELTIPRELIDSTKKDGTDESFIVLVDGSFTSYVEKSSNKTSRTLLIQLAIENKELEIIGTHLASSESNNIPTSTPVPSSQPTNQTSIPKQKPTEIPSEKSPIHTPQQSTDIQEILSKIFQFNLPNLPLNVTGGQLIAYSVISSAILILIIVIASLKKSKIRKQMHK